jgi:hypothetical protein
MSTLHKGLTEDRKHCWQCKECVVVWFLKKGGGLKVWHLEVRLFDVLVQSLVLYGCESLLDEGRGWWRTAGIWRQFSRVKIILCLRMADSWLAPVVADVVAGTVMVKWHKYKVQLWSKGTSINVPYLNLTKVRICTNIIKLREWKDGSIPITTLDKKIICY